MDTLQLPMLILAVVVFLAAITVQRAIARKAALRSRSRKAIIVSDSAMARSMLIDHADAFSNRPIVPFPADFDPERLRRMSHNINTVPYGLLWRALRCNLTAGVLHPTRLVGLLAPLQRDAVEAVVTGISGGGAGEAVLLRDSLYTAELRLVTRLCFGDGTVGARDLRALEDAMREFFDEITVARRLAASRLARLRHWRRWLRFAGTFNRLVELLLPLIVARQESRSRCGGDDGGCTCYVDSLLDLKVPTKDHMDDDGTDREGDDTRRRPLTDNEMVALVWEFLGAGTETTVSCVEWTLAHLVAQPQVQRKLHREVTGEGVVVSNESLRDLPYLRAVILESLRLHPVVPFIVRAVSAEDAAAAATMGATGALPGGKVVHFTLMGDHVARDRKFWSDPDEFRPERFLAGGEGEGVGLVPGSKEIRMMPFGAGRRSCPGIGLAMMQVRSFVAALVREYDWTPPMEGAAVDLREHNKFFRVMKTPLRACITPHTQLVNT